MTKEQKLNKLLAKKSDLEDRLYNEQCRQHERINNMGFGYGMRHAKIGFSTREEDSLKERISKIDEQIKALKFN